MKSELKVYQTQKVSTLWSRLVHASPAQKPTSELSMQSWNGKTWARRELEGMWKVDLALAHRWTMRPCASNNLIWRRSRAHFPELCSPELSTMTELFSILSNMVATRLLKCDYWISHLISINLKVKSDTWPMAAILDSTVLGSHDRR